MYKTNQLHTNTMLHSMDKAASRGNDEADKVSPKMHHGINIIDSRGCAPYSFGNDSKNYQPSGRNEKYPGDP